jgi:Rrf2 family protein
MFRVTRAEEQAVRLVMRMAHMGGQVTLGDLASAENLPEPTVAKLLGMLRRGGVVDALRGRYGGYVLAGTAETISAAQIIYSVSGDPVAGFPCGESADSPDCPRNTNCGLRPVWQHLEGRLTEVLKQTTVADLLKKEDVAQQTLHRLWPLTGE